MILPCFRVDAVKIKAMMKARDRMERVPFVGALLKGKISQLISDYK